MKPERAFKTAWFSKAARKALITNDELCIAIQQVRLGQADDLGGGVFKKRLSRNMYRSIVLARGGRYWIYVYLFAKKDRANIDVDELKSFRALAHLYARKTEASIAKGTSDQGILEISMTKMRKYKSDAFEAIHSSVGGMYRAD